MENVFMKFNPKIVKPIMRRKKMTTLKDILEKNIEDVKKAQLIGIILQEQGFKCFVEVDSKYIRIEELENHHSLTKENLSTILELKDIEIAKLRTEIGMFNIFYIPISS